MTHMTNFRGEDMKVSHAKGSQQADKKSAQEQSSDQQAAQQTGQQSQQTGQQSGQESGQPSEQESEETTDEQSAGEDEEEDDSDDSGEPVPDGTTAEILQWVGGDQDRAQRALDKEQSDDKPRAGLTGELNKILGK